MERISLSKYDTHWKDIFNEEVVNINNAFVDVDFNIEHIGSTSIPNMEAKPVIDIMLGFSELNPALIIPRMESIGFTHWKEDIHQDIRLMFTRWGRQGERLVNVHAVVTGGDFWDDQLDFRNKLRDSIELAQEYMDLKKSLVSKFEHDPEGYTNAKTEFVNRVLAL